MKHTIPQKLSIWALKRVLRRFKHYYDLQIVDRDNEIQMLRDELANK